MNKKVKGGVKMEEEEYVKYVYIRVPVDMYKEMQRYNIFGEDLNIWFIGEIMKKIKIREEEQNAREFKNI